MLDENRDCAGGGRVSGNQKWFDPDHPELGMHNAGNLVLKQKAAGLPHGKENRKRFLENENLDLRALVPVRKVAYETPKRPLGGDDTR